MRASGQICNLARIQAVNFVILLFCVFAIKKYPAAVDPMAYIGLGDFDEFQIKRQIFACERVIGIESNLCIT